VAAAWHGFEPEPVAERAGARVEVRDREEDVVDLRGRPAQNRPA